MSVDDVAGGVQVKLRLTFEIEGGTKPACVAEVLFRYYEWTPTSAACRRGYPRATDKVARGALDVRRHRPPLRPDEHG